MAVAPARSIKIELTPIAAHLDNQPGWHELGSVCFNLASYLHHPGSGIPAVLGSLYGAALELGSFVEIDEAAGRDTRSDVTSLDPPVRRPLQDVLSELAPWLRRLPTVRELDDQVGMFLAAHTIQPNAREVVAAVIDVELIGSGEATRLQALLNAGERGGFISSKAGRRGLLSVRNLAVATAAIFANMILDAAVTDYATRSTIAKRAGTKLAQAEDAITEIMASLPSDVATAMRQLTAQAKATELKPTGHHQRMEGPPDTVDQSTN